ncbi:MAG: MFS transporter [Erysipelothrix sp.]|nr:MFS transporter [Erysipelothrix sp.]
MRKVSMQRWILVTILFAIFANIAHPVTPRFIKGLGLGDSMFGWAFAGMAFTNFLFSPMWAALTKKWGSVNITVVSLIVYGLSQLMFGYATSASTIMMARLLGGLFVGGIQVSQLTYIVNNADEESKGKTLVNNATMQIVFGTIGYLIGGVIGDYSIIAAFHFQFIGLCVSAAFVFFFVTENPLSTTLERLSLKLMSPFTPFMKSDVNESKFLRNIFIISIVASVASVLYDQTFNYYMADYFNFEPSVNGIIKAITGITALVSNSTLTLWIIKKANISKALGYIFMIVSTLIVALISINNPLLFLVINILYFTIHAAYLPLVQKVVTDSAIDQNTTIGKINALKSLGMIIGAIIAGQGYAISKQLPFILASILFMIIGFMSLFNRKVNE